MENSSEVPLCQSLVIPLCFPLYPAPLREKEEEEEEVRSQSVNSVGESP